jgi:hypothetical protein
LQLTLASNVEWMEFRRRREGMTYALQGGLWLHCFVLNRESMAHLVSSSHETLLAAGLRLGMRREWLQYKPLKFPPSGERMEAWHWDLRGRHLELALALAASRR